MTFDKGGIKRQIKFVNHTNIKDLLTNVYYLLIDTFAPFRGSLTKMCQYKMKSTNMAQHISTGPHLRSETSKFNSSLCVILILSSLKKTRK